VMEGFRFNPFFEKRRQIGGEVLDHRQIPQRLQRQPVVLGGHLVDMGSAGPARFAIYHHRAAATHPDPAGEAVAQGWIGVLLNPADNIENGLIFAYGNIEGFKLTFIPATAPDRHTKHRLIGWQIALLLRHGPELRSVISANTANEKELILMFAVSISFK